MVGVACRVAAAVPEGVGANAEEASVMGARVHAPVGVSLDQTNIGRHESRRRSESYVAQRVAQGTCTRIVT